MDVRVAGHQVDTGDSLREHAQRRVAEITEKYFSRSVGANVTFGRGPNNDYTCDIIAPVVQGVVLLGGVMIVLVNLFVDILYAIIDPRIRLES